MPPTSKEGALKVGSRQNLKNQMDVRREFYLQKKNVLATMFECTMRHFHENLNLKISCDVGVL